MSAAAKGKQQLRRGLAVPQVTPQAWRAQNVMPVELLILLAPASATPITLHAVELIQPDSMPAVICIVWPTAPTITTPARYNEVASTAMRLLAEASTMLARIKASKRL
jgi:hypothetical protein